jgi:Domain of unknown function (DUF5753)
VKITLPSGYEAKAVREYLTDCGWRVRASRRHLLTWVDCEEDARAISAALTGAGLMTAATRIEIERQVSGLSGGIEAQATALRWYEPLVVPGLLQTEDYR